jgi:choline kinase
VILAAGMGERLALIWPDRPKGFLSIGGRTLIERSLDALRERGIERTVIVAGYCAEEYRQLAARVPGLEIVENPDFASTGSMASLDLGLERIGADALVLESDLFYDSSALDAVLRRPERDVLLASTPTGAGDEVWIEAPQGRVRALSKDPTALGSCDGELVGITRVSTELGEALREAYARLVAERGHHQIAYDTDALPVAAARVPVALLLLPGLLWGEIDTPEHHRRVRDVVCPAWAARRATEARP